jgi:hypothetical protein
MCFLHKNEYRIFKPVKTTVRRGLRRKIEMNNLGCNTYTHGMSQRNSLYCYLKQTKNVKFVSSFTKLENRKVDQVLSGLVPLGVGRRWGKGVGGRI